MFDRNHYLALNYCIYSRFSMIDNTVNVDIGPFLNVSVNVNRFSLTIKLFEKTPEANIMTYLKEIGLYSRF